MTHLDPRTQKLVEALEEASEAIFDGFYQTQKQKLAYSKIKSVLSEASTPLKEFPPGSGMTKLDWREVQLLLELNGECEKEAAACRQIAEGLSE